MNRKEFVAEFAKANHLPKTQSAVICNSVFDFLRKKMEEEEYLYIYGLGTFKHKIRAEHRVVNPKNRSELMVIPPQTYISFTPSPLGQDEEEEDGESLI